MLWKKLLEELKMCLLNFSFVMIYIIHKMLVLLTNHMNFFKDNIFECFFNRLLFFQKKISFTIYNDRKFKAWKNN